MMGTTATMLSAFVVFVVATLYSNASYVQAILEFSTIAKPSYQERALRVLEKTPLIDGHNDLAILIRGRYKNHIYGPVFRDRFENGGLELHTDLARLDKGKSGGAFWSLWMPCPSDVDDFSDDNYQKIVKATYDQLDLAHRLAAQYPHYFTPTSSHASALAAHKAGRLISPYAIEGLHQIGNSLANLRAYYRLGARYATLNWNCHTRYSDAATISYSNGTYVKAPPLWGGVSKEGRNVVREMNRLGMIVDLAHVSADTMRDVLGGREGEWEGSIAPPMFSHSSAYAICPHPRNVPDDVLELVKKRESVVMINFSGDFVSCKDVGDPSGIPEFVEETSTMAHVVKHIRYIGEKIGYDYVGIGTDYDGIDKVPRGLEDVSKFPDLVAELLRQGVSEEDAGKIVGGNLLRVWKEVDAVKERLKEKLPLEDEVSNQWWRVELRREYEEMVVGERWN